MKPFYCQFIFFIELYYYRTRNQRMANHKRKFSTLLGERLSETVVTNRYIYTIRITLNCHGKIIKRLRGDIEKYCGTKPPLEFLPLPPKSS